MKVAIASDHGGYELKESIKEYLIDKKIDILDLGTNDCCTSVDYPEYGLKAALSVINKNSDLAIVVCGTGIGISIAANKVKGIRCALCHDEFTAKMSRMHNDANMLALGGRVLETKEALKIVETWLNTEFEGDRHIRRLNEIKDIENKYLSEVNNG